jgi:UTP--glucose-1-phosphate uridylyltransferase
VCEVSDEDVKRYCSLKTDHLEKNIYAVSDMVEKPQTEEEKFSNFAILGRVVLTPDIFDILANTAPGAGGEIQLTDAMKELARTVGMTAVEYEGKRFDMGDKLGFLQANVEFALNHPTLGEKFREYLKDFSSKL